jgi:drug/metabolite transporter (DMT)-like permease
VHDSIESVTHKRLMGIALMIGGTQCFLILDVLAKHLSASIPVLEVVWGRYIFHLGFIVILMRPKSIPGLFATKRPLLQLFRSVLLLSATLAFFTALKFMPLAEATALGFTWPLMVTALSVVLLKEHVGMLRWLAIVVGFLGAGIIIRPGIEIIAWSALMPLVMAASYSLYQILTRMVGSDDSPMTSLFFNAVFGAVVMSAVLPFIWEPIVGWTWLEMAVMGAVGGFGHFLVIKALQLSPASVLAPFAYLQLVVSFLYSWVIFGDVPDPYMIFGAAVIAGAGLFVIYRERRLESNTLS